MKVEIKFKCKYQLMLKVIFLRETNFINLLLFLRFFLFWLILCYVFGCSFSFLKQNSKKRCSQPTGPEIFSDYPKRPVFRISFETQWSLGE